MATKNTVVINIDTLGDMETGIHPIHEIFSLELPAFYDDEEERARVRDIMHRAFSELYDESAIVRFSDECPDCGYINGHFNSCPSRIKR